MMKTTGQIVAMSDKRDISQDHIGVNRIELITVTTLEVPGGGRGIVKLWLPFVRSVDQHMAKTVLMTGEEAHGITEVKGHGFTAPG
jgi:hypothetical protein